MDAVTKTKKRRWQVLPKEGQGECDFNPELDAAFADDSPAETRRNAAIYQAIEAQRLARDYALLRPGTQRGEINGERMKEIRRTAAAWHNLAEGLSKRKRGW